MFPPQVPRAQAKHLVSLFKHKSALTFTFLWLISFCVFFITDLHVKGEAKLNVYVDKG